MSVKELRASSPALLMHYTRSMAADDSRWSHIGDYAIWTGNQQAEESPFVLMELRQEKVLTIPQATSRPVMHRIPAGTPYRVSGLFGFWHASDADTVWVQAEYEGKRFYSMMLGGSQERPSFSRCEWYCPRCARPLRQRTFDTASASFKAFLSTALEWVREFNADATARTCSNCGFSHPLGYGFDPQDDTEAEAGERKSW
ncbi:hypothetical protein ACF1G5_24365 [Streptomyces coeruleorubidus]|uniref:hypothetical protein n=1 Tax=Streptomyces coeruleorubidus TaxID=116188 RepID=UPI0036FA991C